MLLSHFILADCTSQQEQQAKTLWQESRTMQYGIEKYHKLQKASSLCSLDEIEIDIQIFLIQSELDGDNLSSKKLDKLDKSLSTLYSMNNFSFSSTKRENSTKIQELKDRLANIRLKVETNEQKLAQINEYLNPKGRNKGFGKGEKIPIPIQFNNGGSRVRGNKNINYLTNRIKNTLRKNPNAKFTITGYASSKGRASVNKRISKKRAINTKAYIERSIPKGHIVKVEGKGESNLICNTGYGTNIGGNEYRCIGGVENEASSRRVEVLRIN